MTHAIEILRTAQKQLSKIERKDQSRIIQAIYTLADVFRPPSSVLRPPPATPTKTAK